MTLRDREKFAELYGILRTKREAEELLRGLVTDHGLCARFLGLEKGRTGACFSHQVKQCRGACVGAENPALYNVRLRATLLAHRVQKWPYNGPVGIREHHAESGRTDVHVIDRWCYLGTATDDTDIDRLIQERPTANIERDTYQILTRYFRKTTRKEIIDLSHTAPDIFCFAE